jgi:hypothetical protein
MPDLQTEEFRFIVWIARNPDAGEVIRGTKMGARKVRWRRKGTGKSSGVRVIYYHFSKAGLVLLRRGDVPDAPVVETPEAGRGVVTAA